MPEINFDAAFDNDDSNDDTSEQPPLTMPEIVITTPFDSKLELVKVINSFENVEKQIVAMRFEAKDLKITDAASFNSAGER